MIKITALFCFLLGLLASGVDSQRSVKVTSVLTAPFLMESENRLYGYCFDLMTELGSKLGADMNLRVVRDGKYGSKMPHGNWSGMIGEVLSQEADMAIAPLTISANRLEVLDFSQPFLTTGIAAIVRKPKSIVSHSKWLAFLGVFSARTWVFLVIAWTVVTAVLYGISRINRAEINDQFSVRRSWHDPCWVTVTGFLFQPSGLIARGLPTRILLIGWYCFAILVLLTYGIAFFQMQTVQRDPRPADTIDSLAAQTRVKFGLQKGGSTQMFFKNSQMDLAERMWNAMSSQVPDVKVSSYDEGINRVRHDENYAFLLEEVAATYAISRDCELSLVGPNLNQVDYGIAMRKNSPYKDMINAAIVDMKQSGAMLKLSNKWWKDMAICTHVTEQTATWDTSILHGAFFFLFLMIVLSVAAALIQFGINRSLGESTDRIIVA